MIHNMLGTVLLRYLRRHLAVLLLGDLLGERLVHARVCGLFLVLIALQSVLVDILALDRVPGRLLLEKVGLEGRRRFLLLLLLESRIGLALTFGELLFLVVVVFSLNRTPGYRLVPHLGLGARGGTPLVLARLHSSDVHLRTSGALIELLK